VAKERKLKRPLLISRSATKKRWRDRFIGALAAGGFHLLKHLSGLSYICTLAKYGFSFKQYLFRIYLGQFVLFTTRTNITLDWSNICPEAKYDQIHYFIQCSAN